MGLLGRLNQEIAVKAQDVIFMVSGQPFFLKKEGVSLGSTPHVAERTQD